MRTVIHQHVNNTKPYLSFPSYMHKEVVKLMFIFHLGHCYPFQSDTLFRQGTKIVGRSSDNLGGSVQPG